MTNLSATESAACALAPRGHADLTGMRSLRDAAGVAGLTCDYAAIKQGPSITLQTRAAAPSRPAHALKETSND